MRNESNWKPSKFILKDGRLRANPDARYVSVASRLYVAMLADALQDLVGRYARGRMLDLGCGAVPLYGVYRRLVCEVVCVDWESSPHNVGHADYLADLTRPLAFAGHTFDTVLLTDVLEHIPEPDRVFDEVRRVTSPSGVVIGSVPFLYRLHEEPHDYFRYTDHRLRRYAHHHHLTVEVLEPYGVGTDVLCDTLGKLVMPIPGGVGRALAGGCQRIGLGARTSRFVKRLNAHHRSMPLGYVFAFRV